ncbi:hypothetical protein [Paraburkholderia fungorum]|uniref:hypothetical protein n=1 Tax=Paraburkholderia fungorum TaxID=134537 RepID=UPI0038BB0E65
MWVRGVATAAMAAAVWSVSGAAIAAGYAEVWNPPEAAGHATGHVKNTAGGAAPKHGGDAKATPKHAASSQHGTQRVASEPKSGAKPSQASEKKVAVKAKPAVATQGKKPHAQMVQVKPDQTKPTHADPVQAHTAHPPAATVTAKTGPVKPPAPQATAMTSPADPAANPATANSGSLPPILH